MRANYHTHTRWCRHAVGEIEDYIETAIQGGLEVLAITEHVPHRDNRDPNRMQWEEFTDYDKALNQAIEQYRGRIRIIKGMECEYYPEEMDDYRIFRDTYGYELLILGQHRCGADREIDNFAAKGPYEMDIYAKTVCAGLETGMFNILAHPDVALVKYSGGWDEHSEKAMRQIFEVCQQRKIPVEINVNGMRNKKEYPSRDAFLLSKEYDLTYLINADAHDPQYLCGQVIEEAEQFAKELGIEAAEFLPGFEKL